MQNRDIEFTSDGKAILSKDTYEELRMFCRMHGETDLPVWFPVASKIEYSKLPKEVKKLTDE